MEYIYSKSCKPSMVAICSSLWATIEGAQLEVLITSSSLASIEPSNIALLIGYDKELYGVMLPSLLMFIGDSYNIVYIYNHA